MEEPVVETRGLKREYILKGGNVRALDGVDLTVRRGEFLAVAGPSGSGKTTLLNLIGALDKPSEGSVKVEGRDLTDLSGRDLARLRRDRIGFVFQAYNLIPVLTVLENVEYVMLLQGEPREDRRDKARDLIKEVGLTGMEGRRPAELSGGQQQRVAVARAIVSRPALVLADEPTANLDSVTGGELMETMARLNRELKVTFLFSSHDQMVLDRARRLVRLRDGRVESDQVRS